MQKLSPVEKIKTESDGLRGTIAGSLTSPLTGAISEDDQSLIKFHGMYQQDDRDKRETRAAKKLERLYSFMIRLRLPGGFMTPEQWIEAHHVAGEYSTGVIKITTRQTIQLHGLLKSKLKPVISAFNLAGLDSIATCGDVNRNVACSSHPAESNLHAEVFSYASQISEMLKPKTRAYYEIWLDGELLKNREEELDPLYEDRYLPRKFKIGIAIPPNNDIDVLTNDIGLVAIINNNKLEGFNVAIGGGLSSTHGNPANYARLASVIGFVKAGSDTLKTVYEILTVQRDYGNRSDRKQARLKYTVDKYGLAWFKNEVEKRSNVPVAAARPFEFTSRTDRYGWIQSDNERWHYTLFVENGRVVDTENLKLKAGLLEIARSGKANFRFTSNQNLILADIVEEDKYAIEEILIKSGIKSSTEEASPLRKNAMACVAYNTCPLALAEAQRYLPSLLSKIEKIAQRYELGNEEIIIRMTGCPNGCARSANAEIGFIGTAYGKYNLHIGGDHYGYRLNSLFKENLTEDDILKELDLLFSLFKIHRKEGERFGDFSQRFVLEKQPNAGVASVHA